MSNTNKIPIADIKELITDIENTLEKGVSNNPAILRRGYYLGSGLNREYGEVLVEITVKQIPLQIKT